MGRKIEHARDLITKTTTITSGTACCLFVVSYPSTCLLIDMSSDDEGEKSISRDMKRNSHSEKADHDDDNAEADTPPRRRGRRQAAQAAILKMKQKERIIDAVESEEDDEEEPSSRKRGRPAKRKPGPGRPRKDTTQNDDEKLGRGPASERTCPHCSKVMSTQGGLEYHICKFS
jgi:hypothetical protein